MEITSIEPFLKYFSGIRERTMRVGRLAPPDKMDWSYAAGKFTMGDLLRHIAVTERYMWGETVQGKPSRYVSHGKELAESHEAILSLMEKLHAESMDIFSRLSEADLKQKCLTPAGAEIQTSKWLRAMVEHEIHHRGQIYLYLGMLGVRTHPIFGLTSEQVRSIGISE
jgi:uncharacterized damage-inducible protein DinB